MFSQIINIDYFKGPEWGRFLRWPAPDVQGLLQAYGHQQGWPARQKWPAPVEEAPADEDEWDAKKKKKKKKKAAK